MLTYLAVFLIKSRGTTTISYYNAYSILYIHSLHYEVAAQRAPDKKLTLELRRFHGLLASLTRCVMLTSFVQCKQENLINEVKRRKIFVKHNLTYAYFL